MVASVLTLPIAAPLRISIYDKLSSPEKVVDADTPPSWTPMKVGAGGHVGGDGGGGDSSTARAAPPPGARRGAAAYSSPGPGEDCFGLVTPARVALDFDVCLLSASPALSAEKPARVRSSFGSSVAPPPGLEFLAAGGDASLGAPPLGPPGFDLSPPCLGECGGMPPNWWAEGPDSPFGFGALATSVCMSVLDACTEGEQTEVEKPIALIPPPPNVPPDVDAVRQFQEAQLVPPPPYVVPPPIAAPDFSAELCSPMFCAPPAASALGSAEIPTVGSAGHLWGVCKPCAFMHTKGCSNGIECKFCHLCFPGEKK
eukprot:CAMPEP_0177517432 /NCGR_PEP_ID=MMETSP0369-20130122/45970_1 /TAXON_ID=447022 ORGANISM="Scrippsiella hangoei-like, Strain SHHI-4" /NCGR_SAMPLE_ID=MMETSP0369 /ASSEMBLY_ACC=CAM_ASM_000364 /LENGTH=312 /DNA_ID=CAMNT_0018996435 /DNA_START=47 /DNA_END=983 /DNA_ORIENTATION=+